MKKTIIVTNLEMQLLINLQNSEYTEWLSDKEGWVGDYIAPCDYDMKTVRGVISSLLKKGVINITEHDKSEDGFGYIWVAINTEYLNCETFSLKNIKEVA